MTKKDRKYTTIKEKIDRFIKAHPEWKDPTWNDVFPFIGDCDMSLAERESWTKIILERLQKNKHKDLDLDFEIIRLARGLAKVHRYIDKKWDGLEIDRSTQAPNDCFGIYFRKYDKRRAYYSASSSDFIFIPLIKVKNGKHVINKDLKDINKHDMLDVLRKHLSEMCEVQESEAKETEKRVEKELDLFVLLNDLSEH